MTAGARLRALVAEFRREVQDKLAVVYHGANNPLRGPREVVQKQCEDFLVEQFESALDALLSAPVVSGWQPITTAPWETAILVASGKYVCIAVHRRAGGGFPARWNSRDPDDFTFSGPDRWMPLPAAPVVTQEGE